MRTITESISVSIKAVRRRRCLSWQLGGSGLNRHHTSPLRDVFRTVVSARGGLLMGEGVYGGYAEDDQRTLPCNISMLHWIFFLRQGDILVIDILTVSIWHTVG